ncbi:MAG: tyrosine-type recombinase/integrase [Candidatus Limnocylindrales bacterium]
MPQQMMSAKSRARPGHAEPAAGGLREAGARATGPLSTLPAPSHSPAVGDVPLRELIEEYAAALEVAGRSRRTIDWYRAYLDDFAGFAERDGGSAVLHHLSAATARRWLLAGQAARVRPLAPNSVAGRVRTLRAFGHWLQRELQLDADPLAGLSPPRVPDVLVPSLTAAQMRALLAAVDGGSEAVVRDRAIVLLLLDTGIRLGEIVSLSVGDVDLVEGRCRVMGKGSRERVVPLGGRARRALRVSLVSRGQLSADDPLFVGRRGARLTPRAVQLLVRRLGRAAGFSGRCSPHVLRHSFARAFLTNGGDVFSLQRILGHSPASLQVTRRYVRLLDDDLRAVHRRVSPVDRL